MRWDDRVSQQLTYLVAYLVEDQGRRGSTGLLLPLASGQLRLGSVDTVQG